MASETIKFSLLLRSPANSSFRCESSPEFLRVSSKSPISSSSRLYSEQKSMCLRSRICAIGGKIGILNDRIEEGYSQEELDDDSPVVVDLDPICSENQFDQILSEAQQIGEPVIIVWEANWCRKCIYLKPKLEKLAAEYYPRLRFYCVNVNNVPHKLVARAGVTKMPTIQLWRNCEKQAELIGGHKAYLVVNEVREMIENDPSN